MIDLNTEEMLNVRKFAGELVEMLLQQEGIWTLEIRPEGLEVYWTMVTPMEDIPIATSIRSCRYVMPFIEIRLGRSVEAAAAAILQLIEQSEEEPDDTAYCQICGDEIGYEGICEDCTCEWDEYDDEDDWVEEDSDLDEEDDDEDGD